MFSLLLLCIFLLTSAVCILSYQVSKTQGLRAIEDKALLIAELLNQGISEHGDTAENRSFYADFISEKTDLSRMAIIAPDGTVLLDNKTFAESLPRHDNRQEVIDALQTGTGQAIRTSETLGSISCYYAVRLSDGNVLRISAPMQSIGSIFHSLLPGILMVSALIMLLAYFIARKLTNNILSPIYTIDLESEAICEYDELSPYVRKLNWQRRQIAAQMQDLQTRARLTESITENMKEGLLFVDATGFVHVSNSSAQIIFNEQSLNGKNVLDFCRDVGILDDIKHALSGQETQTIFEKDGRYYQVHGSPMYEHDTISGSILLLTDVTDKHNAEQQRREFSANVSHEMKTPLTTISALSEMLESGMVQQEDQKEFAHKISAQAKRLITMIEELIQLSEFDGGGASQQVSKVDIYQAAQLALRDLQEKAAAKHLTVSVQGARPILLASPRLIDELLYNLIDNAIKYNREGGSVTVCISADEAACILSVSDNGIGIPPAHQSRIFERFYRVDRSRSAKTGGTGLGLSIVKHIAEYYDGNVWVESQEDVGTTIYCRLRCPSKAQ